MIARRGWLALAALTVARANAQPVPEPQALSKSYPPRPLLATPRASPVPPMSPRPLVFPRDHGAHPDTGIEWWYATGWLRDAEAPSASPSHGFQLTFFRSRTGLAQNLSSRFAARQLLFAHAALTDLAERRLVHAERLARWNGDDSAPRAAAMLSDTQVHIGDWRFAREAGAYRATLGDDAAGFAFQLRLAPTQPLLLQGEAGFSRKGPRADQASHYYTQPHLAVSGSMRHAGRVRAVQGAAWLDHEWSQSVLPDGAVGWDWIGINLDDGSALTAFVLRRADGSALWAGGSHRARGGAVRAFAADEVKFDALAHWRSAATLARYPVRWRIVTPAGRFELRALVDAQELDGRNSTGTVYWEGLSELLAEGGARIGLGYLEMTGYAGPLRL